MCSMGMRVISATATACPVSASDPALQLAFPCVLKKNVSSVDLNGPSLNLWGTVLGG